MEIKKFEAIKYRGPELKNLKRKDFIEQLSETLIDGNFFGYVVNGTTYFSDDEILWLHADKENSDGKIIKLDLSNLGIEIGTAEWNESEEEFGEFIPEVNLGIVTKDIKDFKKDIKKYNV